MLASNLKNKIKINSETIKGREIDEASQGAVMPDRSHHLCRLEKSCLKSFVQAVDYTSYKSNNNNKDGVKNKT